MEQNYKIEYITITSEKEEACKEFLNLGHDYLKETCPQMIDWHSKYLNSILKLQTQNKRWLIGLKVNKEMVGFTHFKIDLNEYTGWGYILEFYIIPSFRRKGLGRKLYEFIKKEFIGCEVKDIWLTADKINGEPFWFSIGFLDTGKTENEMKILEISI